MPFFREYPVMRDAVDDLLGERGGTDDLCHEYCCSMDALLGVGNIVTRTRVIRTYISHLPRLQQAYINPERSPGLRNHIAGWLVPQGLNSIFNATFTNPAEPGSPISHAGICDLFGLHSGQGELNFFIRSALKIINTPGENATVRYGSAQALARIFRDTSVFLGADDFAQHYVVQVETMRGAPHNTAVAQELSMLAREL